VRPYARSADRGGPGDSAGHRSAAQRERSDVSHAQRGGVRRLLRNGRTARQGGCLCDTGPGGRFHRVCQREPFRRRGPAALRNGGAAACSGGELLVHNGPMTVEILINVGPRETRAAIVEYGALQELYEIGSASCG